MYTLEDCSLYTKYIKRVLDFLLSTLGIVILSPMLLVVSIIIKGDSKGPVLFKQKRVGKNKKLFTIYKFRTMHTYAPADVPTHMLNESSQYITRFGAFLRRTSIDELPQLFNIFKGDMSVIGPRPVVTTELNLIKERDKYGANNIKPGLSGWAQINGRDVLDDAQKAKLDGEYVDNISFMFDLKCVFETIKYVLRGKDIVEGEEYSTGNNYFTEKVKDRSKQ